MKRSLISIAYSILGTCALAQSTPQDMRTRLLWNNTWRSRRPPATTTSTPGSEPCVGITLWRLRPSQAIDDPEVRERTKDSGEQLPPVRVAPGTPLAEGDRLRISVETTRESYLYVMERAIFAGGAKGAASLLFPAAGSDNRLAPGGVIQISGTSFFKLTRDRADQVNETLTLLILPQPMADPSNSEKIAELEGRWKVTEQGLQEDNQIGKAITRAEIEAGRDRSKVLTQIDALPQTMFQCRPQAGDPFVLDVSLPIRKDSDVTSRGLGIRGNRPGAEGGTGDGDPRAAPAPDPSASPRRPLGGIGGLVSPRKRVTASDFLASTQTEKEGYGLYSYILFGARPESLTSDRWRRYYEAIVAYLDIPAVGEVSRTVPPAGTNVTFLPVALAESELPAAGLTPYQFRFDAHRLEIHTALHQASGRDSSYHNSINGTTACLLTGNYDYARAQGLLALLPDSHMEGPYIISVAEPLSRTRALPAQYLYQDLSSVPPELIRLWVKEFMAQAQENEFWKTRSKDQFVLRLRTAIGVASQQIPDFGKSITWAFISVAPRR